MTSLIAGFNPKKHDEEKIATIVGDNIFLLVSYGTVVSLNKVDDFYQCKYYLDKYGKYDYYLGKVKEGLPNEE